MEETGRRMVVAAAKNGPSGPEIRLESTRGEPGRRSPARRGSGGTMDHPIKPLGGGSIKNRQGRVQSASQNGLARKSAAEGHRWRRRRTDWYYIAGRGAHGSQFIRASRTNCQPAESSGMTGKGANPQEQIPCPQCGRHVQRRNMKKHQRSQHDGVRRRRHACPFCLPGVHKTYSTFQDWKNHLHTTHGQCLGDDDPLDREEYAAGFKLDRWERFHHIEGDEDDRAYQRIATLRKHYGPYQGGVKGEPPGAPSTIRIPHTKGTTPDREVVPAESEFAGSDQDGSDQEEGEITQTEGEGSGTFTQMRPRDSDSGSDETTPGRESWRSARGQELVVLSTPRPRGRGKRRPERREGAAKRPRVESSSSDRRDGSEESRSGVAGTGPGGAASGPPGPARRRAGPSLPA